MLETDIEDSDADFSYTQWGLSLSALTMSVDYTLRSYTWQVPESFPLNTGVKAPWEKLHCLFFEGMYAGNFSENVMYIMFAESSVSFEETIEESFLYGGLLSGVGYMLSDHWQLLAGGGVISDNFETQPFPAGGVKWNTLAESGISVSLIFPVESVISYRSPNQKFFASVDFGMVSLPPASAQMTYQVVPLLGIELKYGLHNSIYRLSDDSLVEPFGSKKYLKTENQRVSLGVNYSPFKHLTCHLGVLYDFSQELSLLENDGDTFEEMAFDDSFGGAFALHYTF
jgi:hypothetical protein